MTDQADLRERLTSIILGRTAPAAAQAIIDEFGLTVETHSAAEAKRSMTRITGAWEWEPECPQ